MEVGIFRADPEAVTETQKTHPCQIDSAWIPRLTLRVGVTGHRPNKLEPEQMSRVSEVAATVLEELSKITEQVRAVHGKVFSRQAPCLRLVTSLAEGADTIVAEAARNRGYQLDVILPFPKAAYVESQGFDADAKRIFETLLIDPATQSLLELDRTADDPVLADSAYLEAGRLMVAHSDILIAVWNGKPEDGIGGTAQILREAIERGVPVIWIKPGGDTLLVTDGAQLSQPPPAAATGPDHGLNLDDLSRVVCALAAPPEYHLGTNERNASDARQRLEQFLDEPSRRGSFWSAYNLMRRLLIGGKFRPRVDYAIDQATETAWSRFRLAARQIGGDDFASRLQIRLESRWRRADNIALHYSHVYRSAYVLNYVLASLAVIAGLMSVFWWNATDAVLMKAAFVSAETLFIGWIMFLTIKGNGRRGSWHTRWLEARSAAELLRSARLLALIAHAPTPKFDPHDHEDAWVEWYVRSTLREIGIPSGTLNNSAHRIAITSAIEDEIKEQIAYNDNTQARHQHLDHKLHVLGERLFLGTFIIGASFLAAAMLYALGHRLEIIDISPQLKDFVKAAVTFLGAGMPALGAALLGIQATGDFKVASEQAARTSRELAALKSHLENERRAPRPGHTSQLLLALTQALISDLRDWAKIYRMRQLTYPG